MSVPGRPFFCLLPLLLSASAWSQTSTAQLTGLVTDPSAAVISGAHVIVTNVEKGVAREAISNNAGYYAVPLLEPGTYRVEIQMPGFKPVRRTGIGLQVDQVARLDFVLQVGDVSETVEVAGTPPALDTATSSLGLVVENRQITELPVNGRNPLAFLALTPGVRIQARVGQNPYSTGYTGWGNFSANGGVANANEVLVDGASITQSRNNALGYIPPVDATEEFRVETSNFSAEYGRTSGAVVNLSIKSGTNRLHGSLYEFFRNKVLNANTFFQNRVGSPRPALTYNQYGGSIGGPIRRNKTFFFATYEGFSERDGNSLTTTVPTALQRVGDFSQTFSAAGQLVQVADPLSTRRNTDGSFARDVFPGNLIPANRLDPVGVNLMRLLWPLPNQPGNRFTAVNNLTVGGNQPLDARQFIGKVDHIINDKWKVFGTYMKLPINRGFWDPFHNGTVPISTGFGEKDDTNNVVLAATAILSPRLVLELRSAFMRFWQQRQPIIYPFDLTSLGFPQSVARSVQFETIPTINVAGVQAFSNATGGVIYAASDSYTESASLSWTHGSHFVKFGGSYRHLQNYDIQLNNGSPIFTFTGQFTSLNPLAVTATSGVGVASFLLGYPATGNVGSAVRLNDRRFYWSAFVQDDWKVTRRLTLNLGFQYAQDSPITEQLSRNAWFDPRVIPPATQSIGYPLAGALQFTGGQTSTPENLFKHEFSPRLGYAFQLTPKTALRGGYGVFWLPNNLQTTNSGIRATPWQIFTQFVSSLDGGVTPHDSLRNPFPNGIVPPPGSTNGANTLLGQDLSVYLRTNKPGYVQNWNFDLQRELWGHVVVDAAYSGSKGTGLPVDVQLNQIPDSVLTLGTALNQQVANPFFGLIGNGILSSSTVARGQLLRPYPQFGSVLAQGANAGSSIYHSLQVKVTKRFQSSLIGAAYTLSKGIGNSQSITGFLEQSGLPNNIGFMDIYNHRLDRSLDAFDSPQRLVLNYTVEAPFGKGKRYLTKTGKLSPLFSGWELTGLYSAQTGTPLFLSTATNLNSTFGGLSRPNSNGQSAKLSGPAQPRLNAWFNTSVFSQPAPFTYGTSGRTLPDVRNLGVHNLDAAVFKNNRFGTDGRYNLQFRAEFFNALNRVQFANPGLVFGTPQFGVVSAQSNSPRQAQLALKFLF